MEKACLLTWWKAKQLFWKLLSDQLFLGYIYKVERDQFVISEHKYINLMGGHRIKYKKFY